MNHLETAIEIAQEAGALLATYFERRIGYELKGAFDLVTDADRASEKLVVERLRAAFPYHNIVAEEGGGHESPSEYRWFVDPLDGTTNFAHGYPMFNVSIGLQRGDETVAGVVYDPMRRETFSAERSAGTYLNGSRVHVSKVSEIPRCLGVTGFPSPKRTNDINIHFWYQIAMASHGVRRSGSAALAGSRAQLPDPSSAARPAMSGAVARRGSIRGHCISDGANRSDCRRRNSISRYTAWQRPADGVLQWVGLPALPGPASGQLPEGCLGRMGVLPYAESCAPDCGAATVRIARALSGPGAR
jgi:fructose-1,6-bisphosphatase/inositol monophosphatase family enzyme